MVPHEITLFAFTRDAETGLFSVADIVETSRHFASHFARRWVRNPEIFAMAATAPKAPWSAAAMREVRR